MNTHVVILAQGDQKRLPDLKIPKQLLRLPACGNVPILNRTLRQVHDHGYENNTHTVVGWPTIADHFEVCPVEVGDETRWRPGVCTLEDPGNSSLKGFARYWDISAGHAWRSRAGRTVVLLGDVVYSWNVIDELFDAKQDVVFAVSNDISPSDGELWGIAWNSAVGADMGAALKVALARHSAHDAVYQPGQMRLWLWAYENWLGRNDGPNPWIVDVRYVTDNMEGDYTADIDLPKHTTPEVLQALSERAAADDAAHGVTW